MHACSTITSSPPASTILQHRISLPGPVPPLQSLVPGSVPFFSAPMSSQPAVPSVSSWLFPVRTPPATPSVISTLPSVSLSFETPGSVCQKGQAAVASAILAQTAPVESAQAPPGTTVTGSLPHSCHDDSFRQNQSSRLCCVPQRILFLK